MNKVLVIAAHPDDETLGIGGTIQKYKVNGNSVDVLILTDGVSARHDKMELQKDAAQKACAFLGVDNLFFTDFKDQRLDEVALIDVIMPIEKIMKQVKPDIVYTHHGGDVNQDHRVAFEATLVAVRPHPMQTVKELYCYEVPSSTEWAPNTSGWSFAPNIYEDISNYIQNKLKALEFYTQTFKSEIPRYPHPRSFEAVKTMAKANGIKVGREYVEAFQLIRTIR